MMLLLVVGCAPERHVLLEEQYREAASQSHCFGPCKVEILKEAYERSTDPEMRGEILLRLVEVRAEEADGLAELGRAEEAEVWRRGAARTGALLLREYSETEAAGRYRQWVAEGLASAPEEP